MGLLRARGLELSLGERPVLRGATLELEAGEILAVLGPSEQMCLAKGSSAADCHMRNGGPLLDQTDLQIEVPAVPFTQLATSTEGTDSRDASRGVLGPAKTTGTTAIGGENNGCKKDGKQGGQEGGQEGGKESGKEGGNQGARGAKTGGKDARR